MAADLVGGAFLSSFLKVLFDRIASREFLDLYKRRKLDAGLLRKLKTTMISVHGLLDHAEEMQIINDSVKKWLVLLRDAVYKADDLIDETAYEALRSKIEAPSSHTITD